MSVGTIFSRTALWAGLALAIPAGAAYAQHRPGIRPNVNPPENCSVVEPVETADIDSYIRAQIQALSLAQKGEWANLKMLETKGGAPAGEVDQTIMGLRKERIDNMCASFIVSYYVNSPISPIASTAKLFKDSYDELGQMSDQMLGINLQKFLQKATGSSPQRQLSTLLERRQEILHKMEEALDQVLLSLIDESRTNEEGKCDHLILSKGEVNDLLNCLDTHFPTLKNSEKLVPTGNFLKQAAFIQIFLTSSYKPANVP